jgi:hypothetical protein
MKGKNTSSNTSNGTYTRYPQRSNIQYHDNEKKCPSTSASIVSTTSDSGDGNSTSNGTYTRYPWQSNVQYQYHDNRKRCSSTSNPVNIEKDIVTSSSVNNTYNCIRHPLCKRRVTLQKPTQIPTKKN